jgi:hypothetical protein
MIILTCLIVCAVCALILNGAYLALSETVSKNTLQPIIKPEERLKRAYINAYFAHVSFDPEVSEQQKRTKHVE